MVQASDGCARSEEEGDMTADTWSRNEVKFSPKSVALLR